MRQLILVGGVPNKIKIFRIGLHLLALAILMLEWFRKTCYIKPQIKFPFYFLKSTIFLKVTYYFTQLI